MENSSMLDIGQGLKEAREKKSLTIDQVQKQTCIHSKVLIALEEGKCDDMLDRTYVKSFLKKYSSYLGVDSEDIVRRYLALHSGSAVQGAAINRSTVKDSAETAILRHRPEAAAGMAIYTKIIFTALSLLLTIALIFSGIFLWKKSIMPIAKTKTALTIKESRGVRAGRASYQKPQGGAASRQKKSLKIIDLKLKEISRSESVKTKPAAGAIPARNTPFETSTPRLRSGSNPGQSRGTPFNLVVKVKEPVLIQLKKDGVLLFKRVLSKGDMESYKVNEVVNIYVARCEAIELIMDGRVLNVPARGVIRNLEITRNGVAIK